MTIRRVGRTITWRCEACGATLTSGDLFEVGHVERVHTATCPDTDAQALLAAARKRHPSTGDVIDVDTGGYL